MNKTLTYASHSVRKPDPRGFAWRVRIDYAEPAAYVMGCPVHDAYIEIEHHRTSDDKEVWKGRAYDNAQFERWWANVFPSAHRAGSLDSFVEAASALDVLLAAGVPRDAAASILADCAAQLPALRPTGTSCMSFEAHSRQFPKLPAQADAAELALSHED